MASSPDATSVPYRARAWHGGALVADSTGAVRVDQADGPPALWFPVADVQRDALPDGVVWADAPAPSTGTDGYVALDHDALRVELVDELDTKRFPTWGDAADLVDVLDVHPDISGEAGVWTTVARADWRRPVVEASQMLGQCVVAAMRQAGGRRVVSSHLVVPRIADARHPVRITLDEVSAGRTFTTLAATVHQGDRVVATGTFLLDATADDVVRHAEPAADVPGPLDCPAFDMAVTGRDLRIVDDAYTGDPDAPVGPPELDTWVRFRGVPDDPALHAGLLAQFTGHMSIAAALRPHAGVGQAAAHVTLSTGINAIALSFHADVRADRWLLYHHRSTVAADGMTHSECRVHDEDGALVASFSVDAMVRTMAPTVAGDARTAM